MAATTRRLQSKTLKRWASTLAEAAHLVSKTIRKKMALRRKLQNAKLWTNLKIYAKLSTKKRLPTTEVNHVLEAVVANAEEVVAAPHLNKKKRKSNTKCAKREAAVNAAASADPSNPESRTTNTALKNLLILKNKAIIMTLSPETIIRNSIKTRRSMFQREIDLTIVAKEAKEAKEGAEEEEVADPTRESSSLRGSSLNTNK